MKSKANMECNTALSKVKIGVEVEVVDVGIINPLLKRRLFEMGITKGVNLTVKCRAPLGSPVCFEVRGYELGLRVEEAELIIVRLRK